MTFMIFIQAVDFNATFMTVMFGVKSILWTRNQSDKKVHEVTCDPITYEAS